MRRAIALALSAVSTMPNALADPPGDFAPKDLCNLAAVKLSAGNGALNVRDAPSSSGRVLSKLTNGATIYVCDETEFWYEIHFGGPSSPCGARLIDGIALSQTTRCESGWVSKQFVELLSG